MDGRKGRREGGESGWAGWRVERRGIGSKVERVEGKGRKGVEGKGKRGRREDRGISVEGKGR